MKLLVPEKSAEYETDLSSFFAVCWFNGHLPFGRVYFAWRMFHQIQISILNIPTIVPQITIFSRVFENPHPSVCPPVSKKWKFSSGITIAPEIAIQTGRMRRKWGGNGANCDYLRRQCIVPNVVVCAQSMKYTVILYTVIAADPGVQVNILRWIFNANKNRNWFCLSCFPFCQVLRSWLIECKFGIHLSRGADPSGYRRINGGANPFSRSASSKGHRLCVSRSPFPFPTQLPAVINYDGAKNG